MTRRIRRYGNYRRVNPEVVAIVVFAALIAAFLSIAMVDWDVGTVSNPAYNFLSAQTMAQYAQLYSTDLTIAMIMFGVVAIAIVLAICGDTLTGKLLSLGIGLTIAYFLIGSAEDVLYFLWGMHGLPPDTLCWSWMWEYKYFADRIWGYWDSSNQVLWTLLWVAVITPITWAAIVSKLHNSKKKEYFYFR